MHKPLISAQALREYMQNRDTRLLLVDCRFDLMTPESGPKAYLEGHLPGAFYVNLDSDLSDKSIALAGRHPLPTAASFTALMRRLGVNSNTHLVAYDGGDMAMAARLWWLARYYGHNNVSVLDGGIPQWTQAGYAIEQTQTSSPATGNFEAQEQSHMRVDYTQVHSAGCALIDSRDSARYKGEIEPIDPVAGHIPGAINSFWKLCLNNAGLFKSPEDLKAHWAWLNEYKQAPIVYCGSGVTACVNLLGLELAGLEGARLFAGSWSEWCQRGGAVETD